MKLNPGWELKVWTLKNISQLDLHEELYQRFKGLKSRFETLALVDLVKVKLAAQYGGIVMDYDYVCVKPFDEIAYRYNYLVAVEPASIYANIPITNTGFIAATPGHEIANLISNNFEKYYLDPEYKARIWKDMDNHAFEGPWEAIRGQSVVAYSILDYCNEKIETCDGVIILPAAYLECPFFSGIKLAAFRTRPLDLALALVYKYTLNNGSLWWFKDNENVE